MKIEIILNHEFFGEEGRILETLEFPFPPAEGDLIDLNDWADPDDFEEEEQFIFLCSNMVVSRSWKKRNGEPILQLYCEFEDSF